MSHCDKMVDAGRRRFLGGAGFAAAGAAVATMVPAQAKAAPGAARVDYPSNRLANISDLRPNEPLAVAYPDTDAPGVLLKLGKRSRAASAPMATSSVFRQPVRTRVFRSTTTARTRR
jgi:arsenite oxidase small subunit